MDMNDRARNRNLASRQCELAESARNQALYRDWEAHGRMDGRGRPMVTVELWTFQEEILRSLMTCTTPDGRELEALLLSNLINSEMFRDDTVVRDHIPIRTQYETIPFGLPVHREESGGLGHHFVPQVGDLAKDFSKLGKLRVDKNTEAIERRIDFLEETVGDILPVRRVGSILAFSPMGNIVRIMGMENMFIAMCDEPELFHRMMEMQTTDFLEMMDEMEHEGVLLPTAHDEDLAQGSYCFTSDLPRDGTALTTRQIWGYLDSQETSGVSPEMHHEFVYPYYERIADRFGLLSYGCCEAVDPIWEDSVSGFKNLRKISISPWCDEEYMGEALRGRKVVFHRKPSPNLLGVDPLLDEASVHQHFAKTVSAARGSTLEITQRDVYTIHGNPGKVARYIEVIREECEKKV